MSKSNKSKSKPHRKGPAGGGKPQGKSGLGFDVTFAAESAAAMVGNRGAKPAGAGPKRESLEFRMLKEGVNEPGMQSLDELLDKTDGSAAKRSNRPIEHNNRQVGHNQTFGADVNRTGVPRRTGG